PAITATGRSTPSYAASRVAPSTTYTYTVDAFDAAGNHSAQSSPVSATTGAASIAYIRSATFATGSRHPATTIALTGRVGAGDLLTGWFGQWDAAGQVQVSDSRNGPWARVQGMTYNTGTGDIALYYLANSKASLTGLTITISASASTYLAGTVGEYSGAAVASPLDQFAMRSGSGTSVDSGPSGAVPAGELIFGALTANNSPGSVTGGSSAGLTLTVRGSTLSYAYTTVASVTAYTYTVDAFDGAGNHSAQSASVSVTTLDWVAPTVPGGVAASAPTPTQVNLTWNASTDNVGVTGYTVYRNGSQLATVNGSTLAYTDNSAAAMTTY